MKGGDGVTRGEVIIHVRMVVWSGSVLKMAELVIGGCWKVADGMARGVVGGWRLRDQRGQ